MSSRKSWSSQPHPPCTSPPALASPPIRPSAGYASAAKMRKRLQPKNQSAGRGPNAFLNEVPHFPAAAGAGLRGSYESFGRNDQSLLLPGQAVTESRLRSQSFRTEQDNAEPREPAAAEEEDIMVSYGRKQSGDETSEQMFDMAGSLAEQLAAVQQHMLEMQEELRLRDQKLSLVHVKIMEYPWIRTKG